MVYSETLTGDDDDLSPEDIIAAAVAAGEFADEVSQDGLDVIADDPLDGFEAESSLDCLEGYEATDTECGKYIYHLGQSGILFPSVILRPWEDDFYI